MSASSFCARQLLLNRGLGVSLLLVRTHQHCRRAAPICRAQTFARCRPAALHLKVSAAVPPAGIAQTHLHPPVLALLLLLQELMPLDSGTSVLCYCCWVDQPGGLWRSAGPSWIAA